MKITTVDLRLGNKNVPHNGAIAAHDEIIHQKGYVWHEHVFSY